MAARTYGTDHPRNLSGGAYERRSADSVNGSDNEGESEHATSDSHDSCSVSLSRWRQLRGYVAVFNQDLVRHYQGFLDRRRAHRPADEYRPATDQEWTEFETHFDNRKVELGNCGRPYGTPCHYEHACVRCPMLHVDPKMLTRLDELEADLID